MTREFPEIRRLQDRGVDHLPLGQERAGIALERALGHAPDLDVPCFKRANGEVLTGAQRLELLAKHWREHVHELEQAEQAGARR